jgi:hypothetical protein
LITIPSTIKRGDAIASPEVIEKVPFSIFIDFLEPVQKVPDLRRKYFQGS